MPSYVKTNRLGESRIANNGQKMTICKYETAHRIWVKFEDGTVVGPVFYNRYLEGTISNPNYKKPTPVGETIIALNGQKMTIIAWRHHKDIDVQFEDGTIVRHKEHGAFKKGQIKNPNVRDTRLAYSQKHIGETNTSVSGQKMTIVSWRGTKDIDVKFEDETIVTTSYTSFNKGCVENPNFSYRDRDLEEAKKRWEGQTKTMNNGLRLTLIEYNGHDSCKGVWEDGTECTFRLNGFNAESIAHPNMTTTTCLQKKKYEGMILHTQYGIDAKILEYRDNNTIMIQFEDGEIKKIGTKAIRINHYIHPTLLTSKRVTFKYHNMNCRCVFETDSEVYYACSCPRCGFDQILSAKEMMKEHVCEN